jgi:hypothetical protein
MTHPDRRLDPRTSLQDSIRRWLSAEAERGGFATLVVADDGGLVVAASDPSARGELLAALAPLPDEARTAIVGRMDVVSTPVTLMGDRYYLCGTRGRDEHVADESSNDTTIDDAVDGVERILAA